MHSLDLIRCLFNQPRKAGQAGDLYAAIFPSIAEGYLRLSTLHGRCVKKFGMGFLYNWPAGWSKHCDIPKVDRVSCGCGLRARCHVAEGCGLGVGTRCNDVTGDYGPGAVCGCGLWTRCYVTRGCGTGGIWLGALNKVARDWELWTRWCATGAADWAAVDQVARDWVLWIRWHMAGRYGPGGMWLGL